MKESTNIAQDKDTALTEIEQATSARLKSSLAARHRAGRRFKIYGVAAIGFAALMLAYLLVTVIAPGAYGFVRHELTLQLPDQAVSEFAQAADFTEELSTSYTILAQALEAQVAQKPETAPARRALLAMVGSFAAHDVRAALLVHRQQVHTVSEAPIIITVPLADKVDLALKHHTAFGEGAHTLKPQAQQWLRYWQDQGLVALRFNRDFFTSGDSRSPEGAGFLGSMIGSLLTLLVCMGIALPVAIMAAIYLEEFAVKNRLTEWLEIAINNLAAVPSIIYGLLGLSIFLNLFGLPRSSALVGGVTLAMLVLPVMIIATRAALRAVPPSMREAAYGLGSTPLQVVWHHVLPYAMPGMMTGAILSVARAIGETAPLLMIGMVAFIADIPRGFTDAATVMPVEIYLWASSPEAGFAEKTSAGIVVLLAMLLALNALAIYLRKRYERSW